MQTNNVLDAGSRAATYAMRDDDSEDDDS